MIKLWRVTVNNWGWDSPKTFYAVSRDYAEKIRAKYPAADPVQYAGNYTEDNAARLLDPVKYYWNTSRT